MQNFALLQRETLEKRHYIRKADPKQRYWFDFASNKMALYQKQFGESFSLIIAGDENIANDYYAIPFPEVSHIFSEPFLSVDENGTRRRWVGGIDYDRLKITRFPDRIDIKPYKGLSLSQINSSLELSINTSFEGRTRDSIVAVRVDQSVFRQSVMENFGFACALSGITEPEILVASHIIPWSIRKDTRLDPKNGILLYSGYDSLFDKGFISFGDELRVIITPLVEACSSDLQILLKGIQGKILSKPQFHPINPDYLHWHQNNKLLKA
jgi:putative restriction endonuclease